MSGELTYPPFLASEIELPVPEQALFHIIPVPYEKSVSYGTGTGAGPSSILNASQQLELYDGTGIPARDGIYTHAPVDCTGTHEEALTRISRVVGNVFDMGKCPVLMGGEHTVTVGALKAMHDRSVDVGIVQFDAHADLRDTYQGSPFSHACVMRRAVDMGFPVFQVGVRSMSPEEHDLRENEESLHYFDAAEIDQYGIDTLSLPDSFPRQVYITFDVDALDPSVMPSTGTPEPGGLNWYQAMNAIRAITETRNVIGLDVVEFAPIPSLTHPDYAIARLLYNTMGFLSRSPR